MLDTPYIIKENNCRIEELYEENECFVKVYLDYSMEENFTPYLINNQIVKAILQKYPNKINVFKSIMYDDLTDFNWKRPMFYSSLFKDIQKEFHSIDILFMEYEKLELHIRKYINDLIRVGCVVGNGKLLFHIVSELRYRDFIKQGYKFETYCDKEILMHNHEIQTLRIHNGKIVDDYCLKKYAKKDK